MKKFKIFICMLLVLLFACSKKEEVDDISITKSIDESNEYIDKIVESPVIDVKFSLGEETTYDNKVVEDKTTLKKLNKEHSVKYYAYVPVKNVKDYNFTYYDVQGNERKMKINENVSKNIYKWDSLEGVFSKKAPIGHKMSYGIDISKHQGDIDFNKVKNAGFDFVIIRICYRGYGKKGNLLVDEMQDKYLMEAKKAGLKVGAYVFSQSKNVDEAVEEAKFAIKTLNGYKLDLPLFFDPETIKSDIARTDDVTGKEFTDNAIAFCEEVKKEGYIPGIYSNMVWEDYYFDMEKLSDYKIWYADYSNIPQTPYNFNFWQFSERGLVDGISGKVDLDVMIE